MTGHRHHLRERWVLALASILVALLARMMIPTGYMPMVEDGHVVITLCAEQNPFMAAMPKMPGMMPMHAMMDGMGHGSGHSSSDHGTDDHGKDDGCGFGGLSLASLAAADPVLLALALLFILTTVFRRPTVSRVAAARFLWPHRTGPPARA